MSDPFALDEGFEEVDLDEGFVDVTETPYYLQKPEAEEPADETPYYLRTDAPTDAPVSAPQNPARELNNAQKSRFAQAVRSGDYGDAANEVIGYMQRPTRMLADALGYGEEHRAAEQGLNEGLSFGFDDELVSALLPEAHSRAYEEQGKALASEHPVLHGAGNVAGAVLNPVNLAATGGAGAIATGALSGAGYAEGDLGDRLLPAAAGGATGGLLFGLGHGLAQGGKAIRRLANSEARHAANLGRIKSGLAPLDDAADDAARALDPAKNVVDDVIPDGPLGPSMREPIPQPVLDTEYMRVSPQRFDPPTHRQLTEVVDPANRVVGGRGGGSLRYVEPPDSLNQTQIADIGLHRGEPLPPGHHLTYMDDLGYRVLVPDDGLASAYAPGAYDPQKSIVTADLGVPRAPTPTMATAPGKVLKPDAVRPPPRPPADTLYDPYLHRPEPPPSSALRGDPIATPDYIPPQPHRARPVQQFEAPTLEARGQNYVPPPPVEPPAPPLMNMAERGVARDAYIKGINSPLRQGVDRGMRMAGAAAIPGAQMFAPLAAALGPSTPLLTHPAITAPTTKALATALSGSGAAAQSLARPGAYYAGKGAALATRAAEAGAPSVSEAYQTGGPEAAAVEHQRLQNISPSYRQAWREQEEPQ